MKLSNDHVMTQAEKEVACAKAIQFEEEVRARRRIEGLLRERAISDVKCFSPQEWLDLRESILRGEKIAQEMDERWKPIIEAAQRERKTILNRSKKGER